MKAIPKRTLLVTCIIILLPMFFGLALWNRLPERMPTHFDFSGTVDDYSGRPFAVIGLPLFILAMQLFCAVMLRADPKKQNISEKLVQLTLWICPAVSLFVGISMYLSALGFAINVSRLGMVFVGLIFIVIGNYLPKCRHNYTVGIRLPWTLDNEDNLESHPPFRGLCMDHRRGGHAAFRLLQPRSRRLGRRDFCRVPLAARLFVRLREKARKNLNAP